MKSQIMSTIYNNFFFHFVTEALKSLFFFSLISWYVGDLTHDKIDSLVKSMSTVPKDGMFLIKDSSTSPGNYCLYVW